MGNSQRKYTNGQQTNKKLLNLIINKRTAKENCNTIMNNSSIRSKKLTINVYVHICIKCIKFLFMTQKYLAASVKEKWIERFFSVGSSDF